MNTVKREVLISSCKPLAESTIQLRRGLNMKNYRAYGHEPYKIVMVHGGPGALGDLGYVADKISSSFGVIEALQTKTTIAELIDEIIEIIDSQCSVPVTLVGHSWGAWLAYLMVAERSDLVSKLVLIGSGPFESDYAKQIESTRLARLDKEQCRLLEDLTREFYSKVTNDKDRLLAEIGSIIENADTYSPNNVDDGSYRIKIVGDMFSGVWNEAEKLRSSGVLLDLASKLNCEVLVIHGEYDPHPVAGVIEPLKNRVEDFESVILAKCGHSPWKESFAHDKFFRTLMDAIQ
jgi:pimeloyl-ACP methyl ester carboxylesterase